MNRRARVSAGCAHRWLVLLRAFFLSLPGVSSYRACLLLFAVALAAAPVTAADDATSPPAASALPTSGSLDVAPPTAAGATNTPALDAADARSAPEPGAADISVPKHSIPHSGPARLPPLPDGFNSHDGGWLQLAYPSSKRHRIQPLIADAEAFREKLRALFGYPVLERVQVRVARTPGEMATLAPEGSPPPKYAEGVAYPGLGLILLTIEPRHYNVAHDLAEVFRHELAHIALADGLAGHDVPLWLNEGFAVHLSGESSMDRLQTLWTATLAETLMPLSQLERRFPDDLVQTPIAYAQSADVVRHLLRTRYSQRFVAMLKRVRGGQPFADAMQDAYGFEVYGIGANSLEDEWRREVAKRYSFWPVLFSGSMVWVGALGLFVVGYVRRRKQQRRTLERWAVEEAAADQKAALATLQGPRMHIVLAPKENAATPSVADFKKSARDLEVPKVEHEGSWHTLH